MLIIGDVSPLAALAGTGRLELLRTVFRSVVVPSGVRDAFEQGNSRLPWWCQVRSVGDGLHVAELRHWLDEQEAEAITLYRELNADALLMDDHIGRRIARKEGVRVIGLIGVLMLARRRGLIGSLREFLIDVKKKTGFLIPAKLFPEVLRRAGESR